MFNANTKEYKTAFCVFILDWKFSSIRKGFDKSSIPLEFHTKKKKTKGKKIELLIFFSSDYS